VSLGFRCGTPWHSRRAGFFSAQREKGPIFSFDSEIVSPPPSRQGRGGGTVLFFPPEAKTPTRWGNRV